jgi:rod shape-determining protein MreC
MNKKLSSAFFVILLLTLFWGVSYFNNQLQAPFITALNSLKLSYLQTVTDIENFMQKHFNQANQIAHCKKELEVVKLLKLKEQALQHALTAIEKENNTTLSLNPNISLVRAISYQKFGDYNRLWIDMHDFNNSKIYGLIYKDSVAGIVVSKKSRPLALLNSDIKSTYAVSVGPQKAPGIAHGNNDANIIVNFIPTWYKILPGDKVVTSGLDNIFFPGISVGTILSVKKSQGYQSAVLKPAYSAHQPNFFYLIRRPY